ncbi:MAG: DnaJ domain-containing protein [bacterium]|nr:DnaJ domain-containing protein [bacterium]
MKFVDYYKVLGVKKTASTSDIRKAYLRLAKEHHPDRGGDETRMNRLNEAYETLKETKARELYDEIHRARYSPDGAMNIFFTDMMSDAGVRQQFLDKYVKEIKLFGPLALACSLAIMLGYGYSTGSAYLIVIAPLLYFIIRLFNALHSLLVQKIRKPIVFSGIKYSPVILRSIAIGFTGLILLTAGLFSFSAAESHRNRQLNSTEIPAYVYETELKEIEKARQDYDICNEQFSEISNKLTKANSQIDSTFSSQDFISYNRFKTEREALVKEFADKRVSCAEMQNSYNQKLDDYRKSTP